MNNDTLKQLKNKEELLDYTKKIVSLLENPAVVSNNKEFLLDLGIELLTILNPLQDNNINTMLGKKAIETYQNAILKML